ncbi:neutral zinc metallopeptidase [Kribbella sp. NPDC051952]|uniref:neutral zinc metallopeptidase n=1 Tax=Kribbella sp. NPDC051952 TaxID=3154851 RepID=UPI00342C266F
MRRDSIGFVVVVVLIALVGGGCSGARPARERPSSVSTPRSISKPVVTATVAPAPPATKKPRPATPSPTRRAPVIKDPVLVRNKLYGVGKVRAAACALPADVAKSDAALTSYGKALVACMNRAWAPLITRSGSAFRPAKIVANDTGVCTEPPSTAFYNSEFETICIDWDSYCVENAASWRTVQLQTDLAHEYGHHLQLLTGIMDNYDLDTPSWAQLEHERRLELQASCLGAAFVAAHRNALAFTNWRLNEWEQIVTTTGDDNAPTGPRDHGSRTSYSYWNHRGFRSADPSSCNTFTAAPGWVS